MTEEPEPYGVSGKPLVLVLAGLVVVAALVVVAYKFNEPPAESMHFERVDAPASPQNVTQLDYRRVHAAFYLEDHLRTASDKGASGETSPLRVEAMRKTLQQETGSDGPVWYVDWDGIVIRIEWNAPA